MRKWCFYFQSLCIVPRFYSNDFQEIIHKRESWWEEKLAEACSRGVARINTRCLQFTFCTLTVISRQKPTAPLLRDHCSYLCFVRSCPVSWPPAYRNKEGVSLGFLFPIQFPQPVLNVHIQAYRVTAHQEYTVLKGSFLQGRMFILIAIDSWGFHLIYMCIIKSEVTYILILVVFLFNISN